MYEYKCTLARVVDGDTVELYVDLGFHITVKETFRLEGINCPERGTPGGTAATAYATAWFAGHVDLICHSTKVRGTDKYGRWLAAIAGADAGGVITILNAELLRTGHAVPYMV